MRFNDGRIQLALNDPTRIVRGAVPMTDFQKAFVRAGHAHAGVLVTLGLVGLILVDAARLSGFLAWVGRLGIPLAAVLISAGFFASSAGRDVTQPNKGDLAGVNRRPRAGRRRPQPRDRPTHRLNVAARGFGAGRYRVEPGPSMVISR